MITLGLINPQSPIPNPQSTIHNPQSPIHSYRDAAALGRIWEWVGKPREICLSMAKSYQQAVRMSRVKM